MAVTDSMDSNLINMTAAENSVLVAPESVEVEESLESVFLSLNSREAEVKTVEGLSPASAELNAGSNLANLDAGEGSVQARQEGEQETGSFVHIIPSAEEGGSREGANEPEAAENDIFLSQSRLNLGSMTASRVDQLKSMVDTSVEKKVPPFPSLLPA